MLGGFFVLRIVFVVCVFVVDFRMVFFGAESCVVWGIFVRFLVAYCADSAFVVFATSIKAKIITLISITYPFVCKL